MVVRSRIQNEDFLSDLNEKLSKALEDNDKELKKLFKMP